MVITTILIIISLFLILILKNPMEVTFSLILIYINSSILLLKISSSLEFLSLIMLVVYIGALCVLFLFVILLLNLKNIEKNNLYLAPFLIFIFSFIIFFFKINYEISSNFLSNDLTKGLVAYFFQNPLLIFLLSLILFLAIILPILIAKDKQGYNKRQDLFFSLSKNINSSLLLKKK